MIKLTTAERVHAMAIGVPAWARRRKRIEELRVLIGRLARAGRVPDAEREFAELLKLVDAHNRWYPIEANLPLDPITSRLMDGGTPWRPMPKPSFEELIAAVA